jgi:hypothetical protein
MYAAKDLSSDGFLLSNGKYVSIDDPASTRQPGFGTQANFHGLYGAGRQSFTVDYFQLSRLRGLPQERLLTQSLEDPARG